MRQYADGTEVTITNMFDGWFGKTVKIVGWNPHDGTYRVEYNSPLYGKSRSTYKETDFHVNHQTQQVINPHAIRSGHIQLPKGHFADFLEEWKKGTNAAFSNKRCSHFWVVDYVSPFVPKEYYSCKYCKVQKEKYDAESKDTF